MIWPMHFRNMDSAIMVTEKCYRLSRLTPNRNLFMRSLHMMGVIEQEAGNYKNSIQYLDSAITLAEEFNDQKRLGQLYNSIGISYNKLNKTKAGMKCILQSAKIKEEIGDRTGTAITYLNIAGIYAEQRDTVNAIKYGNDALSYCYKNEIKELYTDVNSVLGQIYLSVGHPVKAKELLVTALFNSKKENTPLKSITLFLSLSELAVSQNDTEACRKHILDAEDAIRTTNDKTNLSALYLAYARYYDLKKNYHLSEKNASLALGLAEMQGGYLSQERIYPVYIKALKAQGKSAEALQMYETYSAFKDSINAIANFQAVKRMEAEFENERKEHEIVSLSDEAKLKETELKRKNNILLIGIIALGIITCFSVALLRLYNKDKRNFKLLRLRSQEIEIKNDIITKKNNDITDSINYARRIQDAVLPDFKNKTSIFKESFILYIPKDILSGDFYWFTEKNGKKIIAATDCTGHGVPGALLSIAGSTFLNEIINQRGIFEPGRILNELSNQVIKSLKQTGAEGEGKDGMDIALVCIDEKAKTIEFAGANNSLWILNQTTGNGIFKETKGDRRPIGYYMGGSKSFSNHKLNYNSGDTFYIFTDGFSDQYGGEKNKKFKRKNLVKLLAENSHKSMEQQELLLTNTIAQWKGDNEQTDDVLVIGVRV